MLKAHEIALADARRIWLRAQKLDVREPFGSGPEATKRAVEHLGYVQIDTINVIERAHHHILYTRIPAYQRADLRAAQSTDKSVFEYWTHALSYVPTRDFRFFLPAMKDHAAAPKQWYTDADPKELGRLKRQIRRDGAISIRDVDNDEDVLIEKDHPWASRKPSKRVLQLGFYNGDFAISERIGMVKTYELLDRHFGWDKQPKAATAAQVREYWLDRALRAHGVVSAATVMYPRLVLPAELKAVVERRVRKKELMPVTIAGDAAPHWVTPEALEVPASEGEPLVHILSPFDPLIIQRKRLKMFFGYDHVFEAYVARDKRKFGYFVLPVLIGDQVVAALDLKTDRAAGRVLIQSWHWLDAVRPRAHKRLIEEELTRFERFQLAT